MDGDGDINVTDVMNIVRYILGQSPKNAPAATVLKDADDLSFIPATDGCQLCLKEAEKFTACQMEIRLDGNAELKGLSTDSGHTALINKVGDGLYKVVLFSTQAKSLVPGKPVLTIRTSEPTDICLSEIMFTDKECRTCLFPETSSSLTNINQYSTEEGNSPTYNVQGIRVNSPQRGIFIRNGKKVVVRNQH